MAYAERRLAAPLRDDSGQALIIVDMNLGDMDTPAPPASDSEMRQIGRMMRLLTTASDQVVADSHHGRIVTCLG